MGAKIADGEDALLWEGYFDELKARGLHGVRMVISYGTASYRQCSTRFLMLPGNYARYTS